ncbi:MAG: hypothetical protein AB1705_10055 [Verrucomicrobiota bacterium]
MGYISHFILARDDEGQAVADSPNPMQTWRGFETSGITDFELARLLCLMRGQDPELDFDVASDELDDGDFESTADPTTWVIRFPETFTGLLAELPVAEQQRLAVEWEPQVDLRQTGLTADELANSLRRLCQLAAEGKRAGLNLMMRVGE